LFVALRAQPPPLLFLVIQRFAARTAGAAVVVASGAVTAKAANNGWDWTQVHFDAVSSSGALVRAVLGAEDSHTVGIWAAR
jgi:hypothetical protein